MGEDISKQVIVVLLILAVLISIIGTWVVLDATSNLSVKKSVTQQTTARVPHPVVKEPQTSGKVSFTVVGKENE